MTDTDCIMLPVISGYAYFEFVSDALTIIIMYFCKAFCRIEIVNQVVKC